MTRKRGKRLSAQQHLFFEFLKKMEKKNSSFTLADVVTATGWAKGTPRDYLTKGYIKNCVVPTEDGKFRVRGVLGLTKEQFLARITQTQSGRVFAPKISHPLARALAERSKDNAVLALELYNRPSLVNRIDGFLLLFSTAWEQLLKAEIIEGAGDEEAILRATDKRGQRLSLSLGECLDTVTSLQKMEVRNLTRLKDLRDKATHFLVPELQYPLGFLFQAGVLNFERHFAATTGETFLPVGNAGLMSLVSEGPDSLSRETLSVKYGERISEEVLGLANSLRDEIAEANDQKFAIPLEYRLRLTKNADDADISVSVSNLSDSSAVVVREAKDPDRTHPYLTSDVVAEVNARLASRLEPDEQSKALCGRTKFTPHDFYSIVHKKKWKSSKSNPHHFKLDKPEVHRYSELAIEEIVDAICGNDGYLESARSHYRNRKNSKRKGVRR